MSRVIRTDPLRKPVFMETQSETAVTRSREKKNIKLKLIIMVITIIDV